MSVADFAKNRRDLRDPKPLGEGLLWGAEAIRKIVPEAELHDIADDLSKVHVPDYRDETTIQKYGDPRKIPSTLPN